MFPGVAARRGPVDIDRAHQHMCVPAYVCAMPKTPKVVPIREVTSEIIAKDENTRRVILAVGPDRLSC